MLACALCESCEVLTKAVGLTDSNSLAREEDSKGTQCTLHNMSQHVERSPCSLSFSVYLRDELLKALSPLDCKLYVSSGRPVHCSPVQAPHSARHPEVSQQVPVGLGDTRSRLQKRPPLRPLQSLSVLSSISSPGLPIFKGAPGIITK